MIANAINVLNDKGIKYKVEQKGNTLSMAFGIIAHGQKTKVTVMPTETNIEVNVAKATHTFDEPQLVNFLDGVLELRSLQDREEEILSQFGLVQA